MTESGASGPDLHSFLDQHPPMAVQQAVLFAADLAEQLAGLHAEGRRPGPLDSSVRVETGGGRPRPVLVASELAAPGWQGQPDNVYAVGWLLAHLLGTQPAAGQELPPAPHGVPESLWSVVTASLEPNPGARPTAAVLARLLRDAARDMLLGVSPWHALTGPPDGAAVAGSHQSAPHEAMAAGASLPGYVPAAGEIQPVEPAQPPRRGKRALLAGGVAVVVLGAIGLVFTLVPSAFVTDSPTHTAADAATETTSDGTSATDPAAPPPTAAVPAPSPAVPGATAAPSPAPGGGQQPGGGGQQPGVPQPTKPKAPPPPPAPPAPGSHSVTASTNYGRANGTVSWTGSSGKASGILLDTDQYPSKSWLQIRYLVISGGSWQQRTASPSHYATVDNGQSKNFSWSASGPIKDVQLQVCSDREGKTYCSGWR